MSRRLKHKESKNQASQTKRLLFMGFIASFTILLLIIRLFYIQVLRHEFYITEINRQRQVSIPMNTGRGIFYDRNLIPLTDRSNENAVVVFPRSFLITEESINFLQEITGRNYTELVNKISTSNHIVELPSIVDIDWQDKRIVNTQGLYIIQKRQRYEEDQILSHVLGYINQIENSGMAGLEKSLDYILMGSPTESIAATLDGRKRILPGEGLTVVENTMKQNNVRLTIDYTVQKISEEVMDKHSGNGAIVISEIKTGEVLSMVSRPNYNPNNIANHINNDTDELYNKAIQMTFPPGSIFKIVLAAEALEKGIIDLDDVHYCSGSERVGSVEIRCNAHGTEEHGNTTFREAFAKSCNSFFIQLGQELGAENIIEMAKKLGLGEEVNIGLLEEEKGNLPSGDYLLGPAIGNISIGQGSIEVTPIQVNQMTQIIGNNGIKQPVYLLKDILEGYETIEKFEVGHSVAVLSDKTTEGLQELMAEVTMQGTGRTVGDLYNITAGKTGTAQSSKRGQEILHAWFTGYFPLEDPKYAITVFVQEGGSGGAVATPIFRDIVENMINLGY